MPKTDLKKPKKKISGGMKFLLGVVILYIYIYFANGSLASKAAFGTLLMLAKIIPVLLVVFVVMIGVNMLVDSGKIQKYLGEESGIKGWLYAMGFGILVSGPPYVLYPLLRDLKKAGMKESLLAVFLYNRNVKIPFIPVMAFYFGISYTLIFSFYIIVFSIFNGLLVEKFMHNPRVEDK